jgi:hypothetical protein
MTQHIQLGITMLVLFLILVGLTEGSSFAEQREAEIKAQAEYEKAHPRRRGR